MKSPALVRVAALLHRALILAGLVCVSASACGDDATPTDAGVDTGVRVDLGSDAGPPWAGWPSCDPSATQQRLSFVHTNDLHANYTQDARGHNRWARIRGFYERTRIDSPYTIFTDGGDDHEKGSIAELLSGGRATLELVHAMEFDARVIGNHDFAWSLAELLDYSRDPHAVVLASNQHYTGPDPAAFGAVDFAVLQVGCVRVGFGGLVSTPWDERDRPIPENFYPEIDGDYDYSAQAQALVDAHRDEVDVFVLIDHIGQTEDEEVARNVPGIDVVLSGHSHTLTAEPHLVGDSIVVQSGSFADFIVRLDVDVDLATHEVSLASYTVKPTFLEDPSPTIDAAVARVMAMYAPNALESLGRMRTTHDETGVADFAARASMAELTAQAAIIDVDTVRGTFGSGDVTAQDMLDAFKVERERPGTSGFNSLYRATVSGAVLSIAASAASERWRYVGPATIDPTATYALVLQKRTALHPDEYLPAGVVLDAPTAQTEVWETLESYARARAAACLYVDVDQPLDGCAP